jgi:hypothetical protein
MKLTIEINEKTPRRVDVAVSSEGAQESSELEYQLAGAIFNSVRMVTGAFMDARGLSCLRDSFGEQPKGN